MRRASPAVAALSLALAACAGGPSPRAVLAAGGGLGELPPQRIGKGQCALFLWARAAADQRILMSLDKPPLARIVLGGRQRDLPRVASAGPELFGQAQRQTFAADGLSLDLDLRLETRREVPGGAVVPDGTLAVTEAGGATTIFPVAGVVACAR